MSLRAEVIIRGPLFTADEKRVIELAVASETLGKIEQRLERSARARASKGRKLIANPKNTMTTRQSYMTLEAATTTRSYRNSGVSWLRKHIGAPPYSQGMVGAMLPAVLRKTGQRIAEGFN